MADVSVNEADRPDLIELVAIVLVFTGIERLARHFGTKLGPPKPFLRLMR
jgi:hypothetical protein